MIFCGRAANGNGLLYPVTKRNILYVNALTMCERTNGPWATRFRKIVAMSCNFLPKPGYDDYCGVLGNNLHQVAETSVASKGWKRRVFDQIRQDYAVTCEAGGFPGDGHFDPE
jgi:hypothetical protein